MCIRDSPNTLVHDILFNSLCHRLTYRNSFTYIRYFLTHSMSRNFHFNCLPLMILAYSPWAMTPLNIIFKLCRYPKNSTVLTVYRSIYLEILNSFPNAMLCFSNRTGFGT